MNHTLSFPENPRIAFVGSGRVATHLALAFSRCGCVVSQVWSRHEEHADRMAELVGARVVRELSAIDDADCCIVSVSDDALPEVVQRLTVPKTVVVHTSGCREMSLLSSCSERYGVLWSPLSFTLGASIDYAAMPLCYEGCDEATTSAIGHLANRVSNNTFQLDSDRRRWTHLAAVVTNNFGNALLAATEGMLSDHGIPFELLFPIVRQTAQRVGEGNLWALQTGPAARSDTATMEVHRTMLAHYPELLQIYDDFSKIIDNHLHPSHD